jgi:hypothetical protein
MTDRPSGRDAVSGASRESMELRGDAAAGRITHDDDAAEHVPALVAHRSPFARRLPGGGVTSGGRRKRMRENVTGSGC